MHQPAPINNARSLQIFWLRLWGYIGIIHYIWEAFGNVWDEGVMFELEQNSVLDSLRSVLQGILDRQKQRVVLNERVFSWTKLTAWLPQQIRKTAAITETITKITAITNYGISYLSIALSKSLPHSKAIKNAKKLSAFGKNDYHCSSKFLQIIIFWKFDHICRIYNQISYKDIWFAKVIIILS